MNRLARFRPFALLSCVLVAACNPYAEYQAKEAVRAQLKDPETAQFTELAIAGKGTAVCGMVNAKNSFGGYVGPVPFMIWEDRVLVADADGTYGGRSLGPCCAIAMIAYRARRDSKDQFGFEVCKGLIPDFEW